MKHDLTIYFSHGSILILLTFLPEEEGEGGGVLVGKNFFCNNVSYMYIFMNAQIRNRHLRE